MEQPKHGGPRKGAGRKPIEDKKITLAIYPRKSRIDFLGTLIAKDVAIKAIERAYQKMKKESKGP